MRICPWLAALTLLALATTATASSGESIPQDPTKSPGLHRVSTEQAALVDAFDTLRPGHSTRDDVVAALGRPPWEFNFVTSEGHVPVQLPEHHPPRHLYYDPDQAVTMRVLSYPGDARRDAYAAVLRDGVLHHTISPVPQDERELQQLTARFGDPEIWLDRTWHGSVLRSVEVAWYPERGLAFVREPHDESFTAKLVMEPRDSVPALDPGFFRPTRDTTAEDLSDAFDELFDDIE